MLAELISSAILYYLLQKKISSTLSNSIQSLINKWVTLWPGSRRGVAREHGDPVWGATRSPGWTARLQLHPDKHHHLQQPGEEHQIRVPGTSFANIYTQRTPNMSSRYVICEYLHSKNTKYEFQVRHLWIFTLKEHQIWVPGTSFANIYTQRRPNTSSRYVICEYLHSKNTKYEFQVRHLWIFTLQLDLWQVVFTTQWTHFFFFRKPLIFIGNKNKLGMN